MIPQIRRRKIGAVIIVDIQGQLAGTWALREKERLSKAFDASNERGIIINLRPTRCLDLLGVKTIFENLPQRKKIGILAGSQNVMTFLDRFQSARRIRILRDETEILADFGQDLVAAEVQVEHRLYPRLKTALPLYFYFEEGGGRVEFNAIATNLSLDGLFAEYIDLKDAEESLRRLSPYDLRLLGLKLRLPRGPVHIEGKVVHRRLEEGQAGVGIKFYGMDPTDLDKLKRFLNPKYLCV